HSPLSFEDARYIFAQLVDAVSHMHSRGISHRDLKDYNVVIDADLKIKPIDLGSSLFVDPRITPRPLYKDERYFAGTYLFASQVHLKTPYSMEQVDVWGMGCIPFAVLHGFYPFWTSKTILLGKLSGYPPCDWRTKLDGLWLVIAGCLAARPEERIAIQGLQQHGCLQGARDREKG
ncbi:kinase-like protein, partial [Trametopsis cervina]